MRTSKESFQDYGISQQAVDEVIRVFEHGKMKHGMDWKGTVSGHHYMHAMEHMKAWEEEDGQLEDESGCHHLAHAVVRLLMALDKDMEAEQCCPQKIEY